MIWDLLQLGNLVEVLDHSSACCDEFAVHFEGEIAQICNRLNSTISAESEDESSVPSLGQVLMDEFQLLIPEDVDRVLGSVHFTTIPLDLTHLLRGSYLGPGGRECLFERGSDPYHLERGSNLTTP